MQITWQTIFSSQSSPFPNNKNKKVKANTSHADDLVIMILTAIMFPTEGIGTILINQTKSPADFEMDAHLVFY